MKQRLAAGLVGTALAIVYSINHVPLSLLSLIGLFILMSAVNCLVYMAYRMMIIRMMRNNAISGEAKHANH